MHPRFRSFLHKLAELSADDSCPYEFEFAACVGNVVRGRNRITAQFLASANKWLLWVDDDMEVCAAHALALLARKVAIVGALYVRRDATSTYVANFFHSEVKLQADGLLQVAECGTGMKLYHRQVFELLAARHPEIGYVDHDTNQGEYGFFQYCVINHRLMPEDYFFDHLCRMAGLPVFVDTRVRVKHCDADGTCYPVGEWPEVPLPPVSP